MNFTTRLSRLMALGLVAGATLMTTPARAQDTGAFADAENGRVWYQTCGSGPQNLVLIHDGILPSAGWDDAWPILCRDFRVLRYDRRGFGRTPAATGSYAAVDDLAAVMKAAGIERAMLVGGSAGGGVAVNFTLAHPERVERIILVGPQVSGLAVSRHFREKTMALVQRAAKGDVDGALRDSWTFAPGHDAPRAKAVQLLTQYPLTRRGPDPFRPAPVARPLLGAIKAPTLILVGEKDIADNHAQAGALEALIPGSTRIVVSGAAHLMYMEIPEAFALMVTRFSKGETLP